MIIIIIIVLEPTQTQIYVGRRKQDLTTRPCPGLNAVNQGKPWVHKYYSAKRNMKGDSSTNINAGNGWSFRQSP